MKFSVAAVFAAVGFADARISTAEKKKLLRKARPVNKDGSHRQLNGEYEVSAYDVISFTDCLSLTWQNENALDENLYAATAAGSIIPQTSYAVFRLINTQNSYSMQSDSDLWMMSLDDWVEATANTEAEDKENYCDACDKSYDVCYPEEDEEQYQEAQQDEGGDNDGGERKMRKKRALTAKTIAHRESMAALMDSRKLQYGQWQQYVNCYTCEARGCFADENGEEDGYNENQNVCDQDAYQYGCTFDEEAVEGFMGEAACADTGIVEYYNGEEYELKAGLICNEDGSGVEMAMFADEDCSLYHAEKSFSETMEGTYLYALLGEAASTIMTPYINSISCMSTEYLELVDENNYDGEQNGDNEQNYPEVSETCQNIMDAASDIGTCGGEEREYNDANDDGDDEDENGQAYPDIWYSYDFTDGEEPDEQDVCFALQDLNGMYSSKHVFNQDTSGNFFDYKAAKNGGSSSSAGKIFGIIVGVAVVVVAAVLIMQNLNSKRDTKKVPLVGNQAGAMA